MIMVMVLFLNSTLLDVKKETYEIYTLHVSNNGQLNTLITIHKEVERDPPKKEKKKKTFKYCAHRQRYSRKFY